MAISLPGFDAEVVYRVLSDFWKDYKQRDQLAAYWGGLSQIMDNEYLQLYQSDFSKALATVPVYWRYQWPKIEFDNWISNEVLHEHHWYERTTTFVDGRNTGEIVEIDGLTYLSDPAFNFVTAGITVGNAVIIAGEAYRVTSVVAHILGLAAVLPESSPVTYEIGEQYFDLGGPTAHISSTCHASHPTDDNTYAFSASSQIAEIEVPWIYTRGNNELTIFKNGSLLSSDDYIESSDTTVKFVPSLLSGDDVLIVKAVRIDIESITLNGVFLTHGVDYEFDEDLFLVSLTEPVTARTDDGLGHTVLVKWRDKTTPVPHSHRQFEETLTGAKSTWTNAVGDAFEPEPNGLGPYQFGDVNAPLEVWVNGARQPRYLQSEPNSITLELSPVPDAGDKVLLKWIRNDQNPEQHKHLRYTTVLSVPAQSFTLPFGIDTTGNRRHSVYVNGVMQTIDENYNLYGQDSSVLAFDEELVPGDIVEIEHYIPEYLYRHEIDPTIYAAPIIQDGIDLPSFVSIEGESHEVRPGWLYSNNDFDAIWIPNLFVNEPTTENNFGDPIGFRRDNSLDYLNSVKALWYCYWNGPAFQIIEDGSKILFGVPFSPQDTSVQRRLEGDDSETVVLEADNGAEYSVDAPLVPIVNAGDDVKAFQPLASGVEVWDYVSHPEWYKMFPNLYQHWDEFSVSGDPFVGFWDDRGTLDDGGFWDDGGPGGAEANDRLNEQIFDFIKWFIFVVNIDASLLKDDNALDDTIFFLDTIKPAYTKYLLTANLPGTDDVFERRASDSLGIEVDYPADDTYPERWDDGGNMDVADSGFHFAVGQGGDMDIVIPFPYRLGDNTLRVWINGVLQASPADYVEVDVTTISLTSPLSGGEDIYLYEDDSIYRVMDRGIPTDEVSFQLV